MKKHNTILPAAHQGFEPHALAIRMTKNPRLLALRSANLYHDTNELRRKYKAFFAPMQELSQKFYKIFYQRLKKFQLLRLLRLTLLDKRGSKYLIQDVHNDAVACHFVLLRLRHSRSLYLVYVRIINVHQAEALSFRELADAVVLFILHIIVIVIL
jgi:hypothetical protein